LSFLTITIVFLGQNYFKIVTTNFNNQYYDDSVTLKSV